MKVRSTLGVLIAAMAAVLAFASPAMAKGGTGGGGGGGVPCATINSWTPSVQTITSGTVVVLDVGVFNGCLDEGAARAPCRSSGCPPRTRPPGRSSPAAPSWPATAR